MLTTQSRLRRFLTLVLCQILVHSWAFAGQQTGLGIVVLSGNNEENVIDEVPPQPFSVRILDVNGNPVNGATVVFSAPSDGPGGVFPTGASFSTISDEEGRALGLLYRPNSIEGAYVIQVRAEYQGQSATATIRQSNVLVKKAKSSSKRKFVIVAVAGAGAVLAATALGGGGSGGNSGTPVRPGTPTITFGSSSIGGQ